MNIILFSLIPLAAGLFSFFIHSNPVRRMLVITVSLLHSSLVSCLWIIPGNIRQNQWFAADDLGILALSATSLLFLGASVYAAQYLSAETIHTDSRGYFSPEAVFSGCMLLFLSAMTAVILSRHMAVLWVAMEATTLVSAPLIYFHRTKRSLEATWKYLLICSVGIALGLLGVFFLSAANFHNSSDMFLDNLTRNAGDMSIPWLKTAFLFLFAGYGTKMGLAPFHTWLPDAHSEAPSVISALLSGALLNCAFMGILRGYQICIAAGLIQYCREIFILFGLLSVIFAAFFILGQTDYKRMLAYSSIEHMGIIILGLGIGGGAVIGSILNMICHSLTKAGLFFAAGNIYSLFRTKHIPDIKGILKSGILSTGILWITGFLLITGTPPSGVFMAKLIILKEIISQKHYWITLIFLSSLAVIFIGMARIFISMTQGEPDQETNGATPFRDKIWRLAPSAIFFSVVIILGLYLPEWFYGVLKNAAAHIGGI